MTRMFLPCVLLLVCGCEECHLPVLNGDRGVVIESREVLCYTITSYSGGQVWLEFNDPIVGTGGTPENMHALGVAIEEISFNEIQRRRSKPVAAPSPKEKPEDE